MKQGGVRAATMAGRLKKPVSQILTKVGRPKTAPKPEGLIGYVDQIGPNYVRGWAADRDQPGESLLVRIYLDDDLVAEGKADGEREDLKRAGYADGKHAYHLPAPTKALFCAERLRLAAVDAGRETTIMSTVLRGMAQHETPVLYLDASDLIEFLTHHRELSGIQRVQAGYLMSLGNAKIGKAACKICARFKFTNSFRDIPFESFIEVMRNAGDPVAIHDNEWSIYIQRFKENLTTRSLITDGDTIFTLGAPWALEYHNDLVRCIKYHFGANYLQIFYDMIPISSPEVVAAPLIPHFARSMAALTIYATHVFSISQHAMEDLTQTVRKLQRPVPECSVIPMGGTITDADTPGASSTSALAKLGITGPFVLCVGTLEPRKNHMLLFQVWRRLVAKHGASNVPKLVLVGRVGWYMDDFMRTLRATDFVERTIVHLMGVSNNELSQLYDACLFTVFPSFSEGWGLPITESHARGKVCVCSNVTSMPEAGGEHAIYIDPYDSSSAFEVCEKLMFDGQALADHEQRLRASFQPQTWADASAGLRSQIEGLADRLENAIPPRKPMEFGRLYRYFATWAAEPDALALRVFENFLDQEDAIELLVGWNWFDIDVHCTWACGPVAALCLVPPPETPSDLVVYLEVTSPPAYKGVGCTIEVDGARVGRFVGNDTRRLMLPLSGIVAGQPVTVRFAYEELRKPSGADLRYLGLGLRTLIVFPRDDLAGRIRMFEEAGMERIGP